MKTVKQSEPGTTTINLREFPVELARRAKAHAALRGITLKQVVVEALEQFLKEHKQ
jgi:hypothetical protein